MVDSISYSERNEKHHGIRLSQLHLAEEGLKFAKQDKDRWAKKLKRNKKNNRPAHEIDLARRGHANERKTMKIQLKNVRDFRAARDKLIKNQEAHVRDSQDHLKHLNKQRAEIKGGITGAQYHQRRQAEKELVVAESALRIMKNRRPGGVFAP